MLIRLLSLIPYAIHTLRISEYHCNYLHYHSGHHLVVDHADHHVMVDHADHHVMDHAEHHLVIHHSGHHLDIFDYVSSFT